MTYTCVLCAPLISAKQNCDYSPPAWVILLKVTVPLGYKKVLNFDQKAKAINNTNTQETAFPVFGLRPFSAGYQCVRLEGLEELMNHVIGTDLPLALAWKACATLGSQKFSRQPCSQKVKFVPRGFCQECQNHCRPVHVGHTCLPAAIQMHTNHFHSRLFDAQVNFQWHGSLLWFSSPSHWRVQLHICWECKAPPMDKGFPPDFPRVSKWPTSKTSFTFKHANHQKMLLDVHGKVCRMHEICSTCEQAARPYIILLCCFGVRKLRTSCESVNGFILSCVWLLGYQGSLHPLNLPHW